MARGRARPPELTALLATSAHHKEVTGASYTGLALAVLLGWVGVPGTGEVALVAAAVVAGRGRLSIELILVLAWGAAAVGGVLGWLLGLKGGRPVVLGPGPLRRARVRALAAGEEVFRRHPLLSVYFAPAWVAGVERMRPAVYLPANAVASLIWTLLVGLGGFYVGRPVLDALSDLGLVGLAVLAVLVVAALAGPWMRARRQREG